MTELPPPPFEWGRSSPVDNRIARNNSIRRHRRSRSASCNACCRYSTRALGNGAFALSSWIVVGKVKSAMEPSDRRCTDAKEAWQRDGFRSALAALAGWKSEDASKGKLGWLEKLTKSAGPCAGWSWRSMAEGKAKLYHASSLGTRVQCSASVIGDAAGLDEARASATAKNATGSSWGKLEAASNCCDLHRLSVESTFYNSDFDYDLSFHVGATLGGGLSGGVASKQKISRSSDMLIRWFNEEGTLQELLLQTDHKINKRDSLSLKAVSVWHMDFEEEQDLIGTIELRRSLGQTRHGKGHHDLPSSFVALEVSFRDDHLSEIRLEYRLGESHASAAP